MLAVWRNPRTWDRRLLFSLFGRVRNPCFFALPFGFRNIFVQSWLPPIPLQNFGSLRFRFHEAELSRGLISAFRKAIVTPCAAAPHPATHSLPSHHEKANTNITIMITGNIHQRPNPNPMHGYIWFSPFRSPPPYGSKFICSGSLPAVALFLFGPSVC